MQGSQVRISTAAARQKVNVLKTKGSGANDS
jgi:hypothetical protein